jgi:hypothetical protein
MGKNVSSQILEIMVVAIDLVVGVAPPSCEKSPFAGAHRPSAKPCLSDKPQRRQKSESPALDSQIGFNLFKFQKSMAKESPCL